MVLVGRVWGCGGVGGVGDSWDGGCWCLWEGGCWMGEWVGGVRDRGRRAGNVNNQPGLQPAL